MKKILYLDMTSGVSGDMMLATMVELGAPLTKIISALKSLQGLGSFKIRKSSADRHGIRARRILVDAPSRPRKSPAQIERMLGTGRLPASARKGAIETYQRLARAEAKVHGKTISKVHFHEVGAADAVIDILGTWLGYALIDEPKLFASAVGLGSGQTRGSHGPMLLPAPATLEILKGQSVKVQPVSTELATPTGAALAVQMVSEFGAMPSLVSTRISYATGKRMNPAIPSVLRGVLGIPAGDLAERDMVVEIAANLDDQTPVTLAPVADTLMAAGALDVCFISVQMKKGRPGIRIEILARPGDEKKMCRIVLEQTTTFGVRSSLLQRTIKARSFETRKTPYGKIRYKIGSLDGRVVTASPEPEDVMKAAKRTRQAPHQVYSVLAGIGLNEKTTERRLRAPRSLRRRHPSRKS